jgi:class 3 adenylate cyclase/pimeloyl-ACP methyl ester carboxylesterase
MIPATQYAQSAGYSIAYQVLGRGPDLVLIPGFVSNVEVVWEIPPAAQFLERLASFSRLITFDKRGTGLSDRVPVDRLPTLEERIDDVRAVMDAAGSASATLFGVSEGGPMAVLFGATHPDRVQGLILYGSYARREAAAGREDQRDRFLGRIEHEWGSGRVFTERSRSIMGDPAMQELLARYERHSASPQAAAAIVRMGYEIDVTSILPSTSLPTLILHRTADPNILFRGAQELRDGIPGARLVELPGEDHVPFFGPTEPLISEIEAFVTGSRPAVKPDRVLATVLFVDIVGSTEQAAELGDRRWRDVLDAFYETSGRTLGRHRGVEVGSAGDGFLAVFDGPGRALRCALELRDSLRAQGLEIRAGLHTGEIDKRGDDVAGIAVHIGARVAAAAKPGEVWASRTVKDLVAGTGLSFALQGTHRLKGVPDPWDLYVVGE